MYDRHSFPQPQHPFATPVKSGIQKKWAVLPYWNVELSVFEKLLMAAGAGGALLLHLDPVLNSGIAKPALFLLGIVCFLSPISGFFFLAASAVLPTTSAEFYALARELAEEGENPFGITESGTKYAFYSWLVASLFNLRSFRLTGIHHLWPIMPWLLWMTLAIGPRYSIHPDLIKSVLFCVMACQLMNMSNGQYMKCLLGFGLGLLVVTFGFWAKTAGLPVTLSDWGGARGEFTRLGSVVVDSVMLWPNLLTGLGTMLGILVAFSSSYYSGPSAGRIGLLAIAALFASVPTLLAGMTHSGILGLCLLGATALGFLGHIYVTQRLSRRGKRFLSYAIVLTIAVGAGVLTTDALSARSRVVALFDFYQVQADEYGATASRDPVWEASLDTISRYPLMGVHFNRGKEKIPEQYASKGWFLSHNVFLDYGRAAGIPGMLLFFFFFAWPSICAVRKSIYVPYVGFFLGHLMLFVFFMSLSFQWYKPFWAFWMFYTIVINDQRLKHLDRLKPPGPPRQPALQPPSRRNFQQRLPSGNMMG